MQFDLFDQGSDSQPGGRQTDLEMLIEEKAMNTNETPSQTAMTLVIDTVGEITLPDGTTAHGVVLVVPVGTSQDERRETLQAAVRIWSERVTIQPVLREIS
jgi:hypothetical protein